MGGSPIQTQIIKIATAQFVDQLLTETASVPIDWGQVADQAQKDLQAVPGDDFEQGYWVDVNAAVVQPNPNIEALRQDLPEEIRSSLNWAEDKQFFFILSVVSPPSPGIADEMEADAPKDEPPTEDTEAGIAFDPVTLQADFLELVDKEAAALIRARNSVVAAWLWRKCAASTSLAGHQIRIDPWCGVLGLEAKGDLDKAIADFTQAIELNPEDASLYLGRSNARQDKGDSAGAIADCTRVIELEPTLAFGSYYNRGSSKFAQGDQEGAVADYSKAIELKSDFHEAYTGRGAAKYAKGDHDGAIADYTKAIELKPNNAKAYHNRGLTKHTKGDLAGAVADYTEAIELKLDFADPYVYRGLAKQLEGDLEGAAVDYAIAIKLKPKYAWAYHARGWLYYVSQAFTNALADFRKALELNSSLESARLGAWLARARLGEAVAATAELLIHLNGRTAGAPNDRTFSICRFLVGQLAETEFLNDAKAAAQKEGGGQACAGYFYGGSKRLIAGDRAMAIDYFERSINTGQKACVEYSSAVAELKLLKG